HVNVDVPSRLREHRLGAGALAHVGRLPRCGLVMTQGLGELLFERCLQHGLGQLLQQPLPAPPRQALSPRLRTSSRAATSSGGCSFAFFGTVSSVAVMTAPFSPTVIAGGQARNTVRSTVPLACG